MPSRLLAFVLCAGCSTYVEHRAALVPHATPVQNIGQPNEHRLAGALGASNIADLGAPREGSDPNAGVAVPSRQLRGALNLGVTRNFSIGYSVEDGLASSAQPIKDTLPPLDDTPVIGQGPTMSYSIDTHSPWRVGVSVEMLNWRVPWVEYSTCIDFCGGQPYTVITHATTNVLTAALGVVPSYRSGDWTFFGGVTARNHPTIREKVISNGFSSDVESGPFNAILHGGVAYNASDRVRFIVEMHQTVTDDPVAYMPAIGFAFELGMGPPIPKPEPQPLVVAPAYAPGASQTDAATAAKLAFEAHNTAQAGECGETRALVARIQRLDAQAYAAAMQDKLIAYCLTP